jgi:hypothetical protein
MFRRTAADLKRAAEMIAAHPADYVIDRFVIEGIPRPRAEWLVWRAKQARRAFVIEKPVEQLDWDSRGIVPEELEVPPPRNARMAKSVTKPFIVLMIVGVVALLFGTWQIVSLYRLRDHGIETRGRVGTGKVSPPYTMIRYTYDTPVGRLRDESIVPWSVYRRLESGDRIVVTYASSPWWMSRPCPRAEFGVALAVKIAGFQIFTGVFFLAFAPYLSRLARRQGRIDLDLATRGSVAIGEVLAIRPFLRVRYRFRADGRDIETEAGLRRPPSVLPRAGDRIVILYDPADPSRNAPAEALNVVFA